MFITDVAKMADFKTLSKEEFLTSYNYLTEDEYEATRLYLNWLMANDQRWIPVTEKLPEEIRTKGYGLCNVIVTHKCAGITRTSLAVFDKGKFYTNNNFKRNDTSVIAWMPLFEPYEEDKE